MHILFCVNNIKFGTKCFVKVEQFVLPFIFNVTGQDFAGIKTFQDFYDLVITRMQEAK